LRWGAASSTTRTAPVVVRLGSAPFAPPARIFAAGLAPEGALRSRPASTTVTLAEGHRRCQPAWRFFSASHWVTATPPRPAGRRRPTHHHKATKQPDDHRSFFFFFAHDQLARGVTPPRPLRRAHRVGDPPTRKWPGHNKKGVEPRAVELCCGGNRNGRLLFSRAGSRELPTPIS